MSSSPLSNTRCSSPRRRTWIVSRVTMPVQSPMGHATCSRPCASVLPDREDAWRRAQANPCRASGRTRDTLDRLPATGIRARRWPPTAPNKADVRESVPDALGIRSAVPSLRARMRPIAGRGSASNSKSSASAGTPVGQTAPVPASEATEGELWACEQLAALPARPPDAARDRPLSVGFTATRHPDPGRAARSRGPRGVVRRRRSRRLAGLGRARCRALSAAPAPWPRGVGR